MLFILVKFLNLAVMLNNSSTSALFANSLITACLTPLNAVTAPIPPPIKAP